MEHSATLRFFSSFIVLALLQRLVYPLYSRWLSSHQNHELALLLQNQRKANKGAFHAAGQSEASTRLYIISHDAMPSAFILAATWCMPSGIVLLFHRSCFCFFVAISKKASTPVHHACMNLRSKGFACLISFEFSTQKSMSSKIRINFPSHVFDQAVCESLSPCRFFRCFLG